MIDLTLTLNNIEEVEDKLHHFYRENDENITLLSIETSNNGVDSLNDYKIDSIKEIINEKDMDKLLYYWYLLFSINTVQKGHSNDSFGLLDDWLKDSNHKKFVQDNKIMISRKKQQDSVILEKILADKLLKNLGPNINQEDAKILMSKLSDRSGTVDGVSITVLITSKWLG